MTRPNALLVAIGVLLALGVAGAGALALAVVQDGERQTRRYVVAERVERIDVESSAGEVEFTASADRAVRVEERTRAFSGNPHTSHEVRDGVLRIRGDCDGGFLAFCRTSFRIALPAGTPVRARVGAGGIDLRGMTATIDVKADAGGISGEALRSARVKAEADAGGIDLEFLRAPTLVSARVDAGGVDIQVPRGSYDVQADVDAGGTDVKGIHNSPFSRRVIRADVDAGGINVVGR